MTLEVGRWSLAAAGILGASGVAAGAFGAHGLKAIVSPPMLSIWQTGATYQLIHALALLALSLFMLNNPYLTQRSQWLKWVAGCWLAGTVIFSGSLYALVLTATPQLGAVTPIGGVLLIFGWLLLTLAGLTFPRPS